MRFARRLLCRLACRPRRATAGFTLAVYLAATVGFPFPTPRPAVDRSTPFPCQDRACGCTSAEHACGRCCCFTTEERWAWAHAHTAEAVAPAHDAARPAEPSTQAEGEGAPESPCCAAGGGSPPETDNREECVRETPDCCAAPAPAPALPRPAAQPERVTWVIGISAQKCCGQGPDWCSADPSLPSLPAPAPIGTPPLVDWLASPDTSARSLAVPPPEPPPRL